MYILITLVILAYLYFLGNLFVDKIKINALALGFLIIHFLSMFPIILVYANIIHFTTFVYIIGVLLLVTTIYMVVTYYNKRPKLQNINVHLIIASTLWIVIYLSNLNFSVLSANGFDDYFYIGFQNQLIHAQMHPVSNNYRVTSTFEGWVYLNSAISKLFNFDVLIYNRFTMSILNIIVTIGIFDSCSKFFNNKSNKYYAYIPLIFIVFPLISFEYWFGSISRLIYRPFYGSSLTTLAMPILLINLFELVRNKQLQVFILICIIVEVVVMIHVLNILFIGFFIAMYWVMHIKNKYISLLLPVFLALIVWLGLKIFIPSLLKVQYSNSTFEYWNIMYDLTRWFFVIVYLLSFIIFITKDFHKKIDITIIWYGPVFIFILFFTNLKNFSFNLVYGFGVQRLLSQLMSLVIIYFIVNIMNLKTKYLRNMISIFLIIISIIFFKTTSIYSSIEQQRSAYKNNVSEFKITNISREEQNINDLLKLVGKNKNILTQVWTNIDYNNDINRDYYYGYVASNLCSLNLYTTMSAQYRSGLVFQSTDVLNFKNIESEISKYKINYLLVSEKYRPQNDNVCNENLNYLYNKFAQKHILSQKRISIIKPKYNSNINIWMSRYKLLKKFDFKYFKSKFGKLYLFKIK